MKTTAKTAIIISAAILLCSCSQQGETEDSSSEPAATAHISVSVPRDIYAEVGYDMSITIDASAEGKTISPYIYGINQYGNQTNYTRANFTAVRQGGNRMTTIQMSCSA